jgi:hypothetical protein
MTTFVANKFDAESDPSRPKLGTVIKHGGMKYKVAEVKAVMASDLTKSLLSGEPPNLRGHDELLYREHPTRPFVQWACWVDRVL